MNDIEAIVGLGGSPLVIYYVTENIKSAWRYIQDEPGDHSPWPLMASVVGALWMAGAFYSGWIPAETVSSPLAAVMLGIGAGAVTSKTYEVIKR